MGGRPGKLLVVRWAYQGRYVAERFGWEGDRLGFEVTLFLPLKYEYSKRGNLNSKYPKHTMR